MSLAIIVVLFNTVFTLYSLYIGQFHKIFAIIFTVYVDLVVRQTRADKCIWSSICLGCLHGWTQSLYVGTSRSSLDFGGLLATTSEYWAPIGRVWSVSWRQLRESRAKVREPRAAAKLGSRLRSNLAARRVRSLQTAMAHFYYGRQTTLPPFKGLFIT